MGTETQTNMEAQCIKTKTFAPRARSTLTRTNRIHTRSRAAIPPKLSFACGLGAANLVLCTQLYNLVIVKKLPYRQYGALQLDDVFPLNRLCNYLS